MITLLVLTIIYSIFSFIRLKLSGIKEEITLSNIFGALTKTTYNDFWDVKKYILLGTIIFLFFAYTVIIAAIINVLYLIVSYLP